MKNYSIDRDVIADAIIFFEDIEDGVRNVCDNLSIPFINKDIQHFKISKQRAGISVQEFYDAECERIVRAAYSFEIATFGYDLATS